ncbi:adenylosuccinate lyase [Candidatus Peregrinibacteria bacterium]|jgi:adenylosuccinate lyase|nr:adenylosuccinate lyase [Candidatus Peregrinibacteria bacterium]
MSSLNLSPLDGRYTQKVSELGNYFSEFALIKYRIFVELKFLLALAAEPEITELTNFNNSEISEIESISKNFSEEDAQKVKEIEATTNHDVKAVEYFLKEKLQGKISNTALEFIHFACTSEDINNLAYALMLRDGIAQGTIPTLEDLAKDIQKKALEWKSIPMLSRTHGQTASPTTLGKEFWIFSERLSRQLQILESQDYLGKLNGATGNFNAHLISYPEVDWKAFSKRFIEGIGLSANFATAQIEPHDFLAEVFHNFSRVNTILIDASRDIWSYVSLGYFKQKLKEGEVGSSTMPHKVNPIDFENAEGNFGLANALFSHLSEKLPISRWQRDLTDSTVMRNLGVAFGYSLLAYKSMLKGLSKLEVQKEKINMDLENSWEVLAEAIQTVMRRYGIEKPYEKLKALTRGNTIDKESIQNFVRTLEIPEKEKERLLQLTPQNYIGLAESLVSE